MIHFHVRGEPRPQGSTRAFIKGGRPVITSATKGLKEWRDAISWEARKAIDGKDTLVGPIEARITFILARPKSHYRADGEVRDQAPEYPNKRPDIDKLLRACLDAMTGVVYLDDAQLARVEVVKAFTEYASEEPGVDVFVGEMP